MAQIWRTYLGHRINIYNAVDNGDKNGIGVKKALLDQRNSISKYNDNDAKALEAFFKAYKKAALQSNGDIDNNIIFNFLKQEIKVPWIDFTLGGSAVSKGTTEKGGILFEKELDKFFNTPDSNLGTKQGTTYLYIGEKTAQQNINDFINTFVKENLNNLKVKAYNLFNQKGEKINKDTVGKVYLKVGVRRNMKVDNAANKEEIRLEIEGKATAKLLRIKRILQEAKFSVKSYTTNDSPSLGDTNSKKAITGVTSYIYNKYNSVNSWGGGIFYNRYPTKDDFKEGKNVNSKTDNTLNFIYERYSQFHKIYELTGLGLTPSNEIIEIGEPVDFLLMNRASEESISVFSVNEVIKKIFDSNQYNWQHNT